MPEFMEIIKKRRSIRHYREDEIPEELLNQILESIRWSPSWGNTQCWEVIVVKDPSAKENLQDALPKSNPSRKCMLQAPVLLVLCGKIKSSGYYGGKVTTKFGDWLMFDLGVATQSVCLTAYNLGLGTVIMGLFDHDKAKKILKVPDEYELVDIIAVGYTAKDSTAPKRREISEFTHYEKF